MIIEKISNYIGKLSEEYVRDLDKDIKNIILMSKSRIRFGAKSDGGKGENISGEFQIFTSDASADTEFSVTHSLGVVPQGYIIIGQDKAGSLYQLDDTGTAWTSTTIYFKSSGTSVTYEVFLIK